MDDIVVLHHIPTSLTGSKGREFVADCTRAEKMRKGADVGP